MGLTIEIEKFNWKKINEVFKTLQKVVNHNSPIAGQGIHFEESDTGTIIHAGSAKGNQSGSGSGGGGPSGGQWITVQVMDDQCNKSTIQVWGIPSSSN